MKSRNKHSKGKENPEEVLTIKKQTLIDAVLELERQETLQGLALMNYAKRLEGFARQMEHILLDSKAIQARSDFLNLFLSDKELGALVNEERIIEWEGEFKKKHRGSKSR